MSAAVPHFIDGAAIVGIGSVRHRIVMNSGVANWDGEEETMPYRRAHWAPAGKVVGVSVGMAAADGDGAIDRLTETRGTIVAAVPGGGH